MPPTATISSTSTISATGPAAFGVIAERFRRAGQPEKAVALCREGLDQFPEHLSARVTLGWSLLDMGEHQEAFDQLKSVLKRAPDNLAAIRGLAELHERGIGLVFESLSDPEPETELDPVMPVMPAPPAELDPVMPMHDAAAAMDFDPVMPALDEDLDPMVEPEVPMYNAAPAGPAPFEIEDVIEAGEPDSLFDLSGVLGAAPAPAPVPAAMARKPLSVFERAPLALRDDVSDDMSDLHAGELSEWLSRVRQRRAGSVSQYMAS